MLRIRYEKLGGHVHCRVFSKRDSDGDTFALTGKLVLSVPEFEDLRSMLSTHDNIVFLEDDK